MDKKYDRIPNYLFERLKNLYPNGYDDGVRVSVPLNTNARTVASIDGKYKDYWDPKGGYDVKGTNMFDPWGRYVSMNNIIPEKLYDEVKVFELEYSDRHKIIIRTMELFNDYLLSVLK